MLKFAEMMLIPQIQKALTDVGYETPTPVQSQTIPLVLEGIDLLGIAQTGTGKTAAFCLPIINNLFKKNQKPQPKSPHALILTPTRELAIQIHQNLLEYGKYTNQKYNVIFGGVSQNKQTRDLKNGTDILVATPGRLLDLIEQKYLSLSQVGTFVLDEADRMLDMGFMKDIKRILPLLPKVRHNLFFSATMPSEIQSLANEILRNPKKIEVTPESTTVEAISQSVMFVDKKDKANLLVHLIKENHFKKVLVFVGMKHVANKVVEKLLKNSVSAAAIHGNKSQNARQKAILDFSEGRVKVLVATDIASRGIDIDGISHVINYELSNIAESYVHRIGRTARAGSLGSAISLVTQDEKSYLVNIEKITRNVIPVDIDQPYHSELAARAQVTSVGKAKAKIEAESKKGFNPQSKKKSKNRNSFSNKKRNFKSKGTSGQKIRKKV
jgi:ATP-dependent RNA helicase RhlE